MAGIADALVGDLTTQLVQFVEANASLTAGIKGEIEVLLTDLKAFSAILKQASKNDGGNDNEVLKDVVENMRTLKTDAEDAISKYAVEKKRHKDKGVLLRYLESPVYYARVNGLAKEIQAIKIRVTKIRQDNADAIQTLISNPNQGGQPTLPRMAPVVEEEDVVGFEDESKTIKNRLMKGSMNLTFISIKGMAGAKRGEVIKDKNANRLCVNSSIMEFLEWIGKSSSGEHVRSFLSSCSKEIEVPNHCLSAIPKSFPLLRVIDVENLKFKVLPKQFYELYHLRFIAVSTELKILPKLFSNFHNMETILFNTTQKSLEVKAEIWSMQKLRHVHTNTSMQLPLPPNTSRTNNRVGSTEIKTLSTISPSSCTSEILDMTPDLQKLGIRGNLVELMESKGGVCLFDNIQKLDRLENLKLIHDALQGNKLRSFPRADKFPRRLRKMTLSNTAFDWMDFNTLGLLYELEVLKLEDNAFRGELCHVSNDVVFRQLQYLRIERVDIVSWTVSKQSFPVLKYLFLRNCTKLDAVPPAFGEIESLMLMELYCTNKSATDSARKIHHQLNQNRVAGLSIFQLSIYPPYHQ
nr:putative late blight resistance protein homolog R1B-14 [Ipomoea batatas]